MLRFTGLNSAALKSKLINGNRLPNEPKIYLATLRYEKDGQWIRFCSLHCISSSFLLTVGQCINKMEKHGGKNKVLVFLENPMTFNFERLQIKAYKNYGDYLRKLKSRKLEVIEIISYDMTLVWVSEI